MRDRIKRWLREVLAEPPQPFQVKKVTVRIICESEDGYRLTLEDCDMMLTNIHSSEEADTERFPTLSATVYGMIVAE